MIDEYMMCGNVGKRIFGDNPLGRMGAACVCELCVGCGVKRNSDVCAELDYGAARN